MTPSKAGKKKLSLKLKRKICAPCDVERVLELVSIYAGNDKRLRSTVLSMWAKDYDKIRYVLKYHGVEGAAKRLLQTARFALAYKTCE